MAANWTDKASTPQLLVLWKTATLNMHNSSLYKDFFPWSMVTFTQKLHCSNSFEYILILHSPGTCSTLVWKCLSFKNEHRLAESKDITKLGDINQLIVFKILDICRAFGPWTVSSGHLVHVGPAWSHGYKKPVFNFFMSPEQLNSYKAKEKRDGHLISYNFF